MITPPAGTFTFTNVTAGTQQFRVIGNGYTYLQTNITVTGGLANTVPAASSRLTTDTNSGNDPGLSNTAITPNTGPAGSSVKMTVSVSDPNSDIVSVIAYCPQMSASYTLNDSGTSGDTAAGDGVYSITATLPNTITTGVYTFYFVAVDSGNNTADIAAASFSVLGCADISRTVTSTWPMFRGNLANTGYSTATLNLPLSKAWEFETEGAVRSSASVDENGSVYFGSNDGKVYALDIQTACEKWNYQTGGQVESSPAVYGDSVIVGSKDGFVYSLDRANGNLEWRFNAKAQIVTSPKVDGGKVYVIADSGTLYVLLSSTGEKLFEYDEGTVGRITPALDANNVYVPLEYVYAFSRSTNGQVWKSSCPIGSTSHAYDDKGALALSDSFVFAGGGDLISFGIADGVVDWDADIGCIRVGVTLIDNILLANCATSMLFKKLAGTGSTVWQVESYASTTPIVVGDKIVSAHNPNSIKKLRVLDFADGSEEWSYTIGSSMLSTPSFANGMVFIGAEDGKLYAYGSN